MTWDKGQSGNPGGRPKGPKSELAKLREAVKHIERKKGVTLYEHFVKQAFKDNAVLTALTKKLVPDLKQIDGSIDRKQLSLLSISPSPEFQELIQAFLGQMASMELKKSSPKQLKEGKSSEKDPGKADLRPSEPPGSTIKGSADS